MEKIKIGVRNLIEFVMRSGDIDSAYRSTLRMQEGIKAHQRIQKAYGPKYKAEYHFRDITVLDDIEFELEGRADGFMEDGDNFLIDEIKSTTRPLDSLKEDDRPLHWAQAKCYGYFCCKERKLDQVDIQLTYVNLDEEALTRKFKKSFSFKDLESFFLDLLKRYLEFSRLIIESRKVRNEAISGLEFPYDSFRQGQRRMSVGVYQAIEEGSRLFVEAPTGIGKTISTLYPAILSMKTLDVGKIFYLTAKTNTQREPASAIELMTEKGLRIKSLTITAKEKICLNDKTICDPDHCPYAKGHFDRVNDAILDIFSHENTLNQRVISEYSKKHRVCPHEFQLDMSDYSDVVICDYNYFFDPKVYLRRAFDNGENDTVILVDEAHNLVDRGRDMYSAQISSSDMDKLIDIFKEKEANQEDKKKKAAYRKIAKRARTCKDRIYEFFQSHGNPEELATEDQDPEFYDKLKSLSRALDPYLAKDREDEDYEEVINIFFLINAYCKIEEIRLDGFLNILIKNGDKCVHNYIWKIRAVDPSKIFESILSRTRAAIFFSATLSPTSFYTELLGGGDNPPVMHLDSPFFAENLRLCQYSLSTRWRDRTRTLSDLAKAIHIFIKGVSGNCMVFFPSYAYMKQVEDFYREAYGDEDLSGLLIQEAGLGAANRWEIMRKYSEEKDVSGFFVLGGLFAEGIDLPGKALEGVAIVSVALPGVSFEQNVIKEYFDKTKGRGFDFAYTYPGMNRVLQAAGRVIRTEEDKGLVLLLDDRFARDQYRRLYPKHWSHMVYYDSLDALENGINRLF